jgi:rhodanese-related sulfurtransferase
MPVLKCLVMCMERRAHTLAEHTLSPSSVKADCKEVVAAAAAARINLPRCLRAATPSAHQLDVGLESAPPHIGRDAVAHLMFLRGLSTIPQNPLLIDVRRHDEVALFGGISEAKHVPMNTLLFALTPPPERFVQMARFQRPHEEQLLIFHSRCSVRAEFAARIACDHGAPSMCP